MSNEEQITKLMELLLQSEQRIDATNKMICDMSEFRNHIGNEYCKHIDDLAGCRDKLLDQIIVLNNQINELIAVNKGFLSEIKDMHDQHREERREFWGLLAKFGGGTKVDVR